MRLKINNRFNKELPSDSIEENYVRQVKNACFSFVNPIKPKKPKLIHLSKETAQIIRIDIDDFDEKNFVDYFSGTSIYPNTKPYAMRYAGHQFGNWAGQLGDGRAINLFEVEYQNKNFTLQLKGAGKTPYSRSGDGLAVLRSSIREHLCSEAMHFLGIPTTRSLCLIETGDEVLRDLFYDGNADYEKGAIVCRVAPSFIRFGSFEIHAAQKEDELLKQLADYTIQYYYPEISSNGVTKYLDFFETIAQKTLDLIIHWQRVGFVHGVMNTDNMSIHGITIDYGPYGWLEDFNLNWTPNTTDSQHKRYAYGNQPEVALWNLYQLANALYPLINDAKGLEQILNEWNKKYEVEFKKMMFSKLGIFENKVETLINLLIQNLQLSEIDYTIFFRLLSSVEKKDTSETAFNKIFNSFYSETIDNTRKETWIMWFDIYLNALQLESLDDSERKEKMNAINPKYVLRNYMAQLAIDDANTGDYNLINELFEVLKKPYDEQPEYEKWFAKRPEWARVKPGCSMLSCSS